MQVKGSYRGHISLIMTPRQAEATQDSISSIYHGLFRSHPTVLTRASTASGSWGHDTGTKQVVAFSTQQAVKVMELDKVLATQAYLDGRGIKIGEHTTSECCKLDSTSTNPSSPMGHAPEPRSLNTRHMCVKCVCLARYPVGRVEYPGRHKLPMHSC